MRTLSVKCQNAYLLCLGIKDVENRTWKTNYRGKLLIHSSGKDCDEIDISYFPKIWQEEVKKNKEGLRYIEKLNQFYKKLYAFYGTENFEEWKKHNYYLKAQAIIGKVNLIDITQDSQSEWAKPGQFHWILKNAILYKTPLLFIKGKLKLWEYNNYEEVHNG